MIKTLTVLVACLALAVGGGCSGTINSVTEEDRQLVDMNVQIAQRQHAAARLLASVIGSDPAGAQQAAAELEALNHDALANNLQLQKNWGPPKERKAYSPEAAATTRDASDKSHTPGFWAKVGGALLAGGAAALAIARSPLARMIPGFGPVFTALDSTMAGIETWMQKKKASGEGAQAQDLADILAALHEDKNVGAFIDKKLKRIQKKLGVDEWEPPDVSPPTAPAPVPAPTPAPATPVGTTGAPPA